MYRETLDPRQLGAWLVAGLCPVAVQIGSSMAWQKLLAVAIICFLAVCAVWRWGQFARWTAIPACALLIIFLGQLLKEAAIFLYRCCILCETSCAFSGNMNGHALAY